MPMPSSEEERQKCQDLAERRETEFIDVRGIQVESDLLNLLPDKLIKNFQVIPVEKTEDKIKIVFADLDNMEAVSDVELCIEQELGIQPMMCVGCPPDVEELIESTFNRKSQKIGKLIDKSIEELKGKK